MRNFFQQFASQLLSLAKRHKVLTTVLVLLCLALTGFGVLIGFVQIVVLLIPIALIAWGLLSRRLRSGKPHDRSEAIAISSYIAVATVLTFVLIQAVPYGKSHANGSTVGPASEPAWKDAPGAAPGTTRELTVRACYGCHSNEVEYPAYANVAPISWMVQSHVDEGRGAVNFSIFKKYARQERIGRESIEVIQEGSMPPSYYTRFGLHPEAKLTKQEKADLIDGLAATFGVSASSEDHHED